MRKYLFFLTLLFVLIFSIYTLIATELGAKYIWNSVVKLLNSNLSGKLEKGTFINGIKISNLNWKSNKININIDYMFIKLSLSLFPLKIIVPYLKINNININFKFSKLDNQLDNLKSNIIAPLNYLKYELCNFYINNLIIYNKNIVTKFSNCILYAKNIYDKHEIIIKRTNFFLGTLSGYFSIDKNFFTLYGYSSYFYKINNKFINISSYIYGSIKEINIESNIHGCVKGYIFLKILPFSENLCKHIITKLRYFNIKYLFSKFPKTNLLVDINIKFINIKKNFSIYNLFNSFYNFLRFYNSSNTQSFYNYLNNFGIIGYISIKNNISGETVNNKLPFINFMLNMYLNFKMHHILSSSIKLLNNTIILCNGIIKNQYSKFNFKIIKLDVNKFIPYIKNTNISGNICIDILSKKINIKLKLFNNSKKFISGLIIIDSVNINLRKLIFNLGNGSINLSGLVKRNYNLLSYFVVNSINFNPFLLTNKNYFYKKRKINSKLFLINNIQNNIYLNGHFIVSVKLKNLFKLKNNIRNISNINDKIISKLKLFKLKILSNNISILIAGNRINLYGGLGNNNKLYIKFNAPFLHNLGYDIKGKITLNIFIYKLFSHLFIKINFKLNEVKFSKYYIKNFNGFIKINQKNEKFEFIFNTKKLNVKNINLSKFSIKFFETKYNNIIKVSIIGEIYNILINFSFISKGNFICFKNNYTWNGYITKFCNTGIAKFNLKKPIFIIISKNKIEFKKAIFESNIALVNIKKFIYSNKKIESSGNLNKLNFSLIYYIYNKITKNIFNKYIETNLTLYCNWNLLLSDNNSYGYINIHKSSGNSIIKTNILSPVKLNDFIIDIKFNNYKKLFISIYININDIGKIKSVVIADLSNKNYIFIKNIPVRIFLKINIFSVSKLSVFFDSNYLINGSLEIKFTMKGTLKDPKINGSIFGDNLKIYLINEGINLHKGSIFILYDKNSIKLKKIKFHGFHGFLYAKGNIHFDKNMKYKMFIKVIAKNFKLIYLNNQNISISGTAYIKNFKFENKIYINGDFILNDSIIKLPDKENLKLGNDIIKVNNYNYDIKGNIVKYLFKNFIPYLNIKVKIGKNFYLKGEGFNLCLSGSVIISNNSNLEDLILDSDIQTIRGSTYRIFGRKLLIENGSIISNGYILNSSINFLAKIRTYSDEVGAKIIGTLQNPCLKLFSSEYMTDSQKLSWLLFGYNIIKYQNTNFIKNNLIEILLTVFSKSRLLSNYIIPILGIDELLIEHNNPKIDGQQILVISKAINNWIEFRYEYGLKLSTHLIISKINLTNNLSFSIGLGSIKYVDIFYTKRFDNLNH